MADDFFAASADRREYSGFPERNRRMTPSWNVEMTEPYLSLTEMCARFDVTARTLRYYEEIELLFPKKQGRTRLYGPRETARMTLILRGRRFGYALEELRQWLLIYDEQGMSAQLRAFLETADRQIAAMTHQHRTLTADLEDLRALCRTAPRGAAVSEERRELRRA
jgi:DNA-binding transcriptional MerR regulator